MMTEGEGRWTEDLRSPDSGPSCSHLVRGHHHKLLATHSNSRWTHIQREDALHKTLLEQNQVQNNSATELMKVKTNTLSK